MTAGAKKKRKRRGYSRRHHGYYAAAVTAAALRQRVHGLTAAVYDEFLHPRGKDGKWIEKLGDVLLSGLSDKRANGKRAKVTDIRRGKGDEPDILVTTYRDNGEFGPAFVVKPENVSQAPARKGRLFSPERGAQIQTEIAENERLAAEFGPNSVDMTPGDITRARTELEAQIPTGVSPEDEALIQDLRDRVHNWQATEAARRYAETEVTVVEPTARAVEAARREDVAADAARFEAALAPYIITLDDGTTVLSPDTPPELARVYSRFRQYLYANALV